MKNCLLFLMAVLLFATTKAQEDSIVTPSHNSLLAFQVQAVDNVILLKWAIEQGWAYKSFDVERSDDGIHFIKVGSRLGISKNSDGEFDFVDATPKRNTALHYRLKLIAVDGPIVYSAVKETKVADATWLVRLKQNPVRNGIELDVETTSGKTATVVVVSNAGQQVATQTFRLSPGKNTLTLSSQSMGPGLYQLIVEAGHERKTLPFIKE